MESGVIKNPIDYFKLSYSKGGVDKQPTQFVLQATLSHEYLPFDIADSVYFTSENSTVPKEVYLEVTNKVYSRLYDTIVNGKSKPMQKGWHTRWYYPEWDNKLNLWFVMDKEGNKCYTQDDIPTYVVDELNTD